MIKYHPIIGGLNYSRPIQLLITRSANRFEKLNGVSVQIIRDRHMAGMDVSAFHFVKSYVWDLVPNNVDYVLYMDTDVIPIRRIDEELPEGIEFAAAADTVKRIRENADSSPSLKSAGLYFNDGVFVAHRSIKDVFDQLKFRRSKERDAKAGHEMNLAIQYGTKVHTLSKRWNYQLGLDDEVVEKPFMLHLSGMAKKYQIMQCLYDLLDEKEDPLAVTTAMLSIHERIGSIINGARTDDTEHAESG